jgi:DNA-binding MarR family transcriptional regulator
MAAYFALMEVGNLLQHAVEQQLRDDGGISYVQFQILATLADEPGGRLRMTDVADRLVHSRSGLTYQATQLQRAGLLIREPSADDERSTVVVLTPSGRDLLVRVLPAHVDVVRQVLFEDMDRTDVTVLADTVGRLRDRMRAAPPRSARRPR